MCKYNKKKKYIVTNARVKFIHRRNRNIKKISFLTFPFSRFVFVATCFWLVSRSFTFGAETVFVFLHVVLLHVLFLTTKSKFFILCSSFELGFPTKKIEESAECQSGSQFPNTSQVFPTRRSASIRCVLSSFSSSPPTCSFCPCPSGPKSLARPVFLLGTP